MCSHVHYMNFLSGCLLLWPRCNVGSVTNYSADPLQQERVSNIQRTTFFCFFLQEIRYFIYRIKKDKNKQKLNV